MAQTAWRLFDQARHDSAVTNALPHSPSLERDPPWTFEAALKDGTVEEWVNLHWHRRLAFALIRPMQGRFESVSPNHLTILSGAIGVGAGISAHRSVEAGPGWLALGALLLMASAVVDCADGMLARLRRQSSEFGKLLDGLVDQVTGISAWYGICYAICAGIELPGEWLFCTFALFSVIIHVALYDQFKSSFVALTSPKVAVTSSKRPQSGFERSVGALHSTVYGAIMRVVGGGDGSALECDPAAARRHLSPAMRKVTYLGLGTQFFVLYGAALLGALTHVWVTFVIAQVVLSLLLNVWVVVVLVSWKRGMARLRAEQADA